MNYIGCCAIARDENYFIEEWVQYHSMIGVEKFIIYDNESKIPLCKTLAKYIKCGLVTVYNIEGISPQQQAYQHCLDHHGDQFRWIAFIDIDEFIVLKKNINLQAMLACYEKYAALVVNWVIFGSNGYINNPPRPITLNLTEIIEHKNPNSTIKSIVQPKYVKHANLSPHFFTYKEEAYAVNELYMPVHANNCPTNTQRIQLNHYIYRGQKEFQNKVDRWHFNHVKKSHETLWNTFFNDLPSHPCFDKSIIPVSTKLSQFIKFDKPELLLEFNDHGLEKKEFYEIIDTICEAISTRSLDLALKLIVISELYHPENLDLIKLKAEVLLLKNEVQKSLDIVNDILKYKFWWEGYIVLYYCYMSLGNKELCNNIKLYLHDLIGIAKEQNADVPNEIFDFLKQ